MDWKKFIYDFFPNERVEKFGINVSKIQFYCTLIPRLMRYKNPKVVTWSYNLPSYVESYCKQRGIEVIRVEDGFLRSVNLGAQRSTPLSVVLEKRSLYFDATEESSLEHILSTYDFANDDELMERARGGISALLKSGLSKYNLGDAADIEAIYGPKDRKRILVIGQVEGDMSLIKGGCEGMTNNDLVVQVYRANPEAHIIYKPHPEVLRKIRKKPPQSDPREVNTIAQLLTENVSLATAFETIDEVHTMTSLAGFEALLRGIPVHCAGMPFYAGWGVTTDRISCPRRIRKLSVDEIFAGAYIIYPKYLHPATKDFISFEEALTVLGKMKAMALPVPRESRVQEVDAWARLFETLVDIREELRFIRESNGGSDDRINPIVNEVDDVLREIRSASKVLKSTE